MNIVMLTCMQSAVKFTAGRMHRIPILSRSAVARTLLGASVVTPIAEMADGYHASIGSIGEPERGAGD
jgi:hypothetical protein